MWVLACPLTFFLQSYYIRPSFFSESLNSRDSDPGVTWQVLLPPSPPRFVPCFFIARKIQLFFPSSTRVELWLPTLGALSSFVVDLFLFLQIYSKCHHGGIRTHGPILVLGTRVISRPPERPAKPVQKKCMSNPNKQKANQRLYFVSYRH